MFNKENLIKVAGTSDFTIWLYDVASVTEANSAANTPGYFPKDSIKQADIVYIRNCSINQTTQHTVGFNQHENVLCLRGIA